MLMESVEIDRRLAHLEYRRPPDQGDIVEVHHVEIAAQDGAEPLGLQARTTCLLRDKRRDPPESTAEAMDRDAFVVDVRRQRRLASQAISVLTVYDFDLVS
jgi:hypothetical protein